MTPAGIAPPAAALFGPAWAERLERELRASESFRSAAAGWKGSLAFVLTPGSGAESGSADRPRGVFVDLAHGGWIQVRAALPADLTAATFRVDGTAAAWARLLRGDLDPAAALAAGDLRLARGSFLSLLPRLGAAKELFRSAQRVPMEL